MNTVVSYCPRCDRTYRTRVLGYAHAKDFGHHVFRKAFYSGQRLRNVRGERNGRAILTDLEASFLRRLYADGVSTYVLGLFFDMTQQAAHRIAIGKSYASG